MVFKCKICGGSLDVRQGEKIAVCEYCGVTQVIPSFVDAKTEEIYKRATGYLKHNEFDKAENLFNQILFEDKFNADAYWNVLMCHYGVTYVKDPVSGKYMPTCNRTLYGLIFDDENYMNAIRYADDEQRSVYIAEANIINDIQRKILSVSRNEKPFDIFISYKDTEQSGARTKDSIKAQELYNKLTAEGYKVFFSRITLEDKVGIEYEPYIYSALASSKVMITVSSSKENIEAVWVKNEWSRYLSFMAKDSGKTLVPLYFDMDKVDLPDDFAHIPAYDMNATGFEQDFVRGIKKLIPLPVMLLEQRKRRNKILKKVGIGAIACAVIGLMVSIPWFAKLPAYSEAMQLYYDKNYPEATWAFADLGSYRDSEKMKEKCELSWRNIQANIKANSLGNGSTAYYVNENGTIDTFNYAPGAKKQEVDINEHGKITSIEMHGNIAALYEDGYMKSYFDLLNAESFIEFNDVIKMSMGIAGYGEGFVILKNDGTVDVPNNMQYDWISEISRWENITEIDCHSQSHGAGGLIHEAAVIGITKDKDLKIALYNFSNFGNETFYDESIHSRFRNVEKVDADLSDDFFNIVALTDDGKLLTEIQGEFNSYNIQDAVDVELLECFDSNISYEYYEIYVLYSNGNVCKYGENNYLLADVVYMDNGVLVTRSGRIYRITKSGVEETEGKTRVLNEWLERMD